MCSPALASLGVQAAGAASSAAGAMFSASASRMGLKLDSAIAKINADKANDNAREAIREGYEQQIQQRTYTGQVKGAERAAMGANNVDMTTGSALNRLVSTDATGEADAQQIRLNAARVAMGYRDEASNDQIKSTLDLGAAKGINPMLTGVTSLLGSASPIASSWYGMRNSGAFGGNAPPMPTGESFGAPSVNLGDFGAMRATSTLGNFRYGTLP